MHALDAKVPPLALTAVFLALIVAVHHGLPGAAVPFAASRTLGWLIGVASVAVLLGAALQFRLRRTTLDPRSPERASQFVARGLYRFSRNPMYVGMAGVLLAAAVWSAHLVAAALVPAFCAYLTRWQIQPEERALEARFGDDYRAYKARVRRWL